jgi:hypothetical protein
MITRDAHVERRQLERLVLNNLMEVKKIEIGLGRRFTGLRSASGKACRLFIRQLVELERRAWRLERLVDSLGETSRPAHNLTIVS